ncbi:SagB/ThcOx family dehydrogenase [Roseibium sediminicola]|uniref:SagB/ThcOx family dehydrogenase n=1 Tax=Roseibium sediminicola TaxID=2933272 RepID=A0ABT0GWP4_9HYPH|nr:SagB/ThcOx family dehydrogenase [Roseibium sp. CAU 1639]MCK7613863.1 SagB/ThcOx family dehydrogenase [Roseibium sp. CAU 1639]
MTDLSLKDALSRRRTVRQYSGKPISIAALEALLHAAQGITGDDGKRAAPSAHALCPLRLFVVAGEVDGLSPGHYAVGPETLDLEPQHGTDLRAALREAAIGDPEWITDAAALIVIAADIVGPSIHFANQPPYGGRGMRYVHMEAGAAVQNLQLQAVAEGLGTVLVGGFHDEAVAKVLGLDAPLAPLILQCVGHPAD